MNNSFSQARTNRSLVRPAEMEIIANIDNPWMWLPPAIALLSCFSIWSMNSNEQLFLFINNDWLFNDLFWESITSFGDPVVALGVLLPLCWKWPKLGSAAILSSLIAASCIYVLKFNLELPRPAAILSGNEIYIIGPTLTQNSFPSGHTTTIFILAGVCCLMKPPLRYGYALVTLATLVGISRISVGAHWPLDIAAGAFLGWTSACIGVYLASLNAISHHSVIRILFAGLCLGCAITVLLIYDAAWPVKLAIACCMMSALHKLWAFLR